MTKAKPQYKAPSGALVVPVSFNDADTATLAQWLDAGQIERLRGIAEAAKSLRTAVAETSSLSDDKAALRQAAELAAGLAQLLTEAPEGASAELDAVFHLHLGHVNARGAITRDLAVMSRAIGQRLDTLPAQQRRTSEAETVGMVAAVLADAGIAPSQSENSRFFKICKVVLKATGVHQSPIASIRGYLAGG